MNFLTDALGALPHIATSPLAFTGYVVVVVSWLVISLRVKRNKNLLSSLDKLPEKDRLQALQLEMGTIKLKSGFTPKQWIRARIIQYYFWGFVIVCLMIIALFAIAVTKDSTQTKSEGNVSADVTVYNELTSIDMKKQPAATSPKGLPTEVKVSNDYSSDGVRNSFWDDDRQPPDNIVLSYEYTRNDDGIVVTPHMPYLDLLKKGGPISETDGDFFWQFPELSVKLVNNTNSTLVLSEVRVDVQSSTINTEPVIRVFDPANVDLVFINDGWGKVHNPTIKFGLTTTDKKNEVVFDDEHLVYSGELKTFERSITVPIVPDYISFEKAEKIDGFGNQGIIAFGVLSYMTDSGEKREIKFNTIYARGGIGGGEAPEYMYELLLEAGKSGYSKYLPVSHSIKPGEAEHFVVRIGTDKSADFDLLFTLKDTGGKTIPGQPVKMDIFIPRSYDHEGKLKRKSEKWKT